MLSLKESSVNLVVATYNRLALTRQSLDSLYTTPSTDIDYMITVIDNGSSDGTKEYLKELFDAKKITTLILLKDNIGVSRGQNVGWKLFENAKYYAKLDNDVVFTKNNWLNDVLNVLDNSPEIGALGYDCEPSIVNYPIVSNGKATYKNKQGNIGGACFFVGKHIHSKLGFWCEEYDKYGEEDADYGMRISLSGFRNAYMIDKDMLHLPEPDDAYVKFKREQREDNLKGIYYRVMNEYANRKRSVYVGTNILNEIKDYEFYSYVKDGLI